MSDHTEKPLKPQPSVEHDDKVRTLLTFYRQAIRNFVVNSETFPACKVIFSGLTGKEKAQ